VCIGEHEIGRMRPREVAQLRGSVVATVLQDPSRNLLPYATVRDNVQFAAGSGARRSDELIERLGLGPLAKRVTGRLSGGEQQRVAITAAVASGAGLLLADEPTSYLDAHSRDEVLAMLSTVNAELGTTVMVVTHDALVAERMQRTVTIRDGRVGAEGRHGVDYAVVGRDGTLQLPPDVLARHGPGTLFEVEQHPDHVTLRRREEPT
jgi:ABC-type lipoprotein export system ATPase subunit